MHAETCHMEIARLLEAGAHKGVLNANVLKIDDFPKFEPKGHLAFRRLRTVQPAVLCMK